MGLRSILLATVLLAGTAAANSRIYMYVDADGVRHYTDVPDNNRYRLLRLSPNEVTESGDHYSPTILARASQYDSIIEKAAASSAVEPNLLRAVIVVESGFNSRAVSKRGAVGLMQLHARHGLAIRRFESVRSEGEHPRRRALLEISDGPLRPERPSRARGVQCRRGRGGAERRADTAVHRDHGLRAQRCSGSIGCSATGRARLDRRPRHFEVGAAHELVDADERTRGKRARGNTSGTPN